ncbi:hypothetical protein BDV12DRAFT_172306 [Aspergillus spectabilis]
MRHWSRSKRVREGLGHCGGRGASGRHGAQGAGIDGTYAAAFMGKLVNATLLETLGQDVAFAVKLHFEFEMLVPAVATQFSTVGLNFVGATLAVDVVDQSRVRDMFARTAASSRGARAGVCFACSRLADAAPSSCSGVAASSHISSFSFLRDMLSTFFLIRRTRVLVKLRHDKVRTGTQERKDKNRMKERGTHSAASSG